MIITILLSLFLVVSTICVHQAAFSILAGGFNRRNRRSHIRLYMVMLGIFMVHMLEIFLYAAGFYIAENIFSVGQLVGENAKGALGLFYTSAVFYTSLGFGDVLPSGHLRFLTGVEALNGLLLIAWSASFLFSEMGGSLPK